MSKTEIKCRKCGEGVMEPTGGIIPSTPIVRIRKCALCGHTEGFRQE